MTVFSAVVFFVMLKSSVVEAFEILLVVFPVGGATKAWPAIIAGVGLAIAFVTLEAILSHGQLKRVPEVRLKLATGLVLFAIGLSWLFELTI